LIANVQELEEAVERSVIICDGSAITAEEVFLGPPPDMRPRGFNLLSLPKRIVQAGLRLFPTVVRGLVVGVFALILYRAIIYFVKGESGGLVYGARVPPLILSRAESPETKIRSIAIGMLAALRGFSTHTRLTATRSHRV